MIIVQKTRGDKVPYLDMTFRVWMEVVSVTPAERKYTCTTLSIRRCIPDPCEG